MKYTEVCMELNKFNGLKCCLNRWHQNVSMFVTNMHFSFLFKPATLTYKAYINYFF